ncbi:hypothetical protein BC833DRAFT_569825 [Globomyces pollinis-pini]|nr:hypothetical protein BC833DRAFT_569825 [Globomyces pollinis-pini]
MHLVNDQRQTMTNTSIHRTIHSIFIDDKQKIVAHLVILSTEYYSGVCHAGSLWVFLWDTNIFRVNFVGPISYFFTFMQRRRNTPGWWYKGPGMVPSFLSDSNTNTFSISTCSFLNIKFLKSCHDQVLHSKCRSEIVGEEQPTVD